MTNATIDMLRDSLKKKYEDIASLDHKPTRDFLRSVFEIPDDDAARECFPKELHIETNEQWADFVFNALRLDDYKGFDKFDDISIPEFEEARAQDHDLSTIPFFSMLKQFLGLVNIDFLRKLADTVGFCELDELVAESGADLTDQACATKE